MIIRKATYTSSIIYPTEHN